MVLVKVTGFWLPRLTVEIKTVLMMDSYVLGKWKLLLLRISCLLAVVDLGRWDLGFKCSVLALMNSQNILFSWGKFAS